MLTISKRRAILGFIISFISLVNSSSSWAQDFKLFEDVDVTGNDAAVRPRPDREVRVNALKPDFTLIGTSRIGDNYSVILSDRNGKKIEIFGQSNVNIKIPENMDFQIIAVADGKVSISLPDSSSCTEFSELGVHCSDAGNIAELTFPTTTPVKSDLQSSGIASAFGQDQVKESENIEENLQNPFAIMRANAQSQDNNTNAVPPPSNRDGGRFVPRRINPDEVPQGMRVVSTPFGDRLVQQ